MISSKSIFPETLYFGNEFSYSVSQNLRKRFVESSATLVFFRTGSYVEKSKRIARKNFPNENDLKRNFIFIRFI
ncbi:hypothetical protein LBBP_02317 [Leptospira borgpetersenii serovar Ballum]|uniref:Uncharacterized protein n=1 Tax=Leptospira borgpetersenii serovar Ballum TaxID=280505 RepID=A0A0S2ISD9_LEPBO|nr:hypothetical protein LBBP_02317 [Leptospira borgpetersenii serovar Ballum]